MRSCKVKTKPQNHGDVLTAISDGMVGLLKEYYGRGPTRAKSYYEDDLVVCVLRGGSSRVEQTSLRRRARSHHGDSSSNCRNDAAAGFAVPSNA